MKGKINLGMSIFWVGLVLLAPIPVRSMNSLTGEMAIEMVVAPGEHGDWYLAGGYDGYLNIDEERQAEASSSAGLFVARINGEGQLLWVALLSGMNPYGTCRLTVGDQNQIAVCGERVQDPEGQREMIILNKVDGQQHSSIKIGSQPIGSKRFPPVHDSGDRTVRRWLVSEGDL